MQTITEQGQPELLRAGEMRAILGIGRSAFYDLAKRDQLPVPTLRLGRRVMFSRRAVEEVLNRRHGGSTDSATSDQTGATG